MMKKSFRFVSKKLVIFLVFSLFGNASIDKAADQCLDFVQESGLTQRLQEIIKGQEETDELLQAIIEVQEDSADRLEVIYQEVLEILSILGIEVVSEKKSRDKKGVYKRVVSDLVKKAERIVRSQNTTEQVQNVTAGGQIYTLADLRKVITSQFSSIDYLAESHTKADSILDLMDTTTQLAADISVSLDDTLSLLESCEVSLDDCASFKDICLSESDLCCDELDFGL